MPQGGLVTASMEVPEENLEALVQYGGKIGDKGTYRAFGNYFNIEPSLLGPGMEAADGWHGSSGGFRADWVLSARDTLSVQGDLEFKLRRGRPRLRLWRINFLFSRGPLTTLLRRLRRECAGPIRSHSFRKWL